MPRASLQMLDSEPKKPFHGVRESLGSQVLLPETGTRVKAVDESLRFDSRDRMEGIRSSICTRMFFIDGTYCTQNTDGIKANKIDSNFSFSSYFYTYSHRNQTRGEVR